MVSFQCSPLSTPDGILGTFRQCAQFQRKKDLDRFVSVVVLDEIGLAEDSPRMPLKVNLNYRQIFRPCVMDLLTGLNAQNLLKVILLKEICI